MSSPETSCPVQAGHDYVHRYVAGTLSREELDEFEPHLLGCARCQAAVREGFAIGAALVGAGAARRPDWRRVAMVALPSAAAALLVLFVAKRREDPLARLARLERPPAFASLAVRDDAGGSASDADSGMAAYAAGRFSDAARLLARVAEPTPALRFYEGAALLLSRQPGRAVAALAQAAARDAGYEADARLLRAKAWLALGRADSALVDLDRARAAGGASAAHAVALADSVRAALGP
jgi:hypothetical protein